MNTSGNDQVGWDLPKRPFPAVVQGLAAPCWAPGVLWQVLPCSVLLGCRGVSGPDQTDEYRKEVTLGLAGLALHPQFLKTLGGSLCLL